MAKKKRKNRVSISGLLVIRREYRPDGTRWFSWSISVSKRNKGLSVPTASLKSELEYDDPSDAENEARSLAGMMKIEITGHSRPGPDHYEDLQGMEFAESWRREAERNRQPNIPPDETPIVLGLVEESIPSAGVVVSVPGRDGIHMYKRRALGAEIQSVFAKIGEQVIELTRAADESGAVPEEEADGSEEPDSISEEEPIVGEVVGEEVVLDAEPVVEEDDGEENDGQ